MDEKHKEHSGHSKDHAEHSASTHDSVHVHEAHHISEHHNDDNSHSHEAQHESHDNVATMPIIALIIIVAAALLFNQYQINTISGMVSNSVASSGVSGGGKELSNINLAELKSTGHTIAAVFAVEDIKTSDDAMAIMFPTGTPDYGEALGVSYDDPVQSLDTLSKMYPGLKAEVEKSNPEGFRRFLNLALKPVGISCEYCCGVGPIGVDNKGNSLCGCQHNPALLAIGLYLSAYTDYNDGEILREVMRWKTLFFPKNMIELGMTVAGGDTSALADLPGMVGGC